MAQILVTVDPEQPLRSLQRSIRKLQGVVSTSVVKGKTEAVKKHRKTGLELAEEDVEEGRVTQWNSVEEMFDTILRK